MKTKMIAGAALLALLSALTATTGCARLGLVEKPDELAVRVAYDGSVVLDDKTVNLNRLAKKLKAKGADGTTLIRVSVPENLAPAHLSAVSAALSANGFRRIIFVGPQQTNASVVPAKVTGRSF